MADGFKAMCARISMCHNRVQQASSAIDNAARMHAHETKDAPSKSPSPDPECLLRMNSTYCSVRSTFVHLSLRGTDTMAIQSWTRGTLLDAE